MSDDEIDRWLTDDERATVRLWPTYLPLARMARALAEARKALAAREDDGT